MTAPQEEPQLPCNWQLREKLHLFLCMHQQRPMSLTSVIGQQVSVAGALPLTQCSNMTPAPPQSSAAMVYPCCTAE